MKNKQNKQKKQRDYYKEISDALSQYENYKYREHSTDWICDRIDWCWKFRKITDKQMMELCDRIVAVMDGMRKGWYDFD